VEATPFERQWRKPRFFFLSCNNRKPVLSQYMKAIAQIKLNPTPEQHAALKQTLQQANAACNDISQTAWDAHTFKPHGMPSAPDTPGRE
jgi:hypothetical protein